MMNKLNSLFYSNRVRFELNLGRREVSSQESATLCLYLLISSCRKRMKSTLICLGYFSILAAPFVVPRRVQQCLFMSCVVRAPTLARFMLHLPNVDPTMNNNAALTHACRYGDSSLVQALLDDERVKVDNGYEQCIYPALLSRDDEISRLTLVHEKSNPIACRKHAAIFGWEDLVAHALDPETEAHETVSLYSEYYRMIEE